MGSPLAGTEVPTKSRIRHNENKLFATTLPFSWPCTLGFRGSWGISVMGKKIGLKGCDLDYGTDVSSPFFQVTTRLAAILENVQAMESSP